MHIHVHNYCTCKFLCFGLFVHCGGCVYTWTERACLCVSVCMCAHTVKHSYIDLLGTPLFSPMLLCTPQGRFLLFCVTDKFDQIKTSIVLYCSVPYKVAFTNSHAICLSQFVCVCVCVCVCVFVCVCACVHVIGDRACCVQVFCTLCVASYTIFLNTVFIKIQGFLEASCCNNHWAILSLNRFPEAIIWLFSSFQLVFSYIMLAVEVNCCLKFHKNEMFTCTKNSSAKF